MSEPLPFHNETTQPSPPSPQRDDLAYIAPMAIFLAITWMSSQWPSFYPGFYISKTIATAIALFVCWHSYTKIRWDFWWLGILVGVIGTVQWIGMQLWLQEHVGFFHPSTDAFNPVTFFDSKSIRYFFISWRLIGAVLVVPVMEELFWRDFLWRQIIAPNDFKLARVGEWSVSAFFIVAGAFATVHGNWWLTAIVWAMMIGGLLATTKSLGACIIAHATTNLLLGLYVLRFQDWNFW